MSTSRALYRKSQVERSRTQERLSEITGVVLMAVGLMIMVSLMSHSPDDPVWYFKETSRQATKNLIGPAGAFLSEALLQLLGLASYLLAVLLALAGWSRFWCREVDSRPTKLIGLASVTVSLAGLLSLSFGEVPLKAELFPAGGVIGHLFAAYLAAALNRGGAFILLVTMLFASLVVATSWSISRGMKRLGAWQRSKTAELLTAFHHHRETRRKEKLRRQVVKKHARRALDEKKTKEMHQDASAHKETDPVTVERRPPPPKTRQEMLPFTPKKGRWTMPPFTVLEARKEQYKPNEKELMERAKLLQRRCREFAVEGQVVQIHPGPVVTTYEFRPDAGIKYSKITALTEDLCLALEAESVRIDRISGKSAVGIEIPNPYRELIGLREILETETFQSSPSRLTLALGKTIDGAPSVSDLTRMPHLLIAGATGSGKSVLLHNLICSVLFKSTPDEVKFILVDPKRVELGVYQDIPHLLTPVVTDAKQANEVLKWVVFEMEGRVRMLASEGVRNIDQYNNILRGAIESGEKREDENGEPLRPLPYIMVVIDEMADLMLVSTTEVEDSITRLAQMARAVGIHLVLATQRPSVDVITGIIKANFPSRISFRLPTRVDSRTILDANGAEQLLGNGDMLFLPPGSARLIRLHGPYVSDAEVGRLVSIWKRMGKAEYDPAILRAQEEEISFGEIEKDELFDKAARLVVESGVASVSHLQRRLRLGYSRAARIVDMLESEGIVGPPDGSKAREVLVGKDYFDEVDRQLR